MVCTGPISYKGHAQVHADIDNLKAALDGANVQEAFLPAISPAGIEEWQTNRYYKTDEEHLYALADAMHEEYKAIVDAGLLLQVDDPRILRPHYALGPRRREPEADPQMGRGAQSRGAQPRPARRRRAERVRWHTCYGINIGPRVH